jgi:putative ABC transport system permease protein
VRTGLGLAWHGLRRGAALPLVSAVVTSAVAMATIITAVGGAASLGFAVDDPIRFGAPWDAGVSAGQADPETVDRVDGIAHAAILGGTEVRIGDQPDVWVQALFPIRGVPLSQPVLIDGRGPVSDDEIALGSRTLERAGAEIGDRVPVVAKGSPGVRRLTVVGRTMVTDGAEPNVGLGGIVTPAGMERIEMGTADDGVLALGIEPSADRSAVLAELRRAFPTLEAPFPVPSSLDNAQRISSLPLLLALMAALLAAITLAHALVVSVRRNRRELAVCRVLGFTRAQVGSAVCTQATLLAATAVVLGVPLGVIGARWGWRTLAHAFGIAVEPRVPPGVIAACVVGVLLLANLTALPTARAASRRRTAVVLRSE